MASAFSDVEHPWSWLHRDEIKCSCCGDQVNPFNTWFRHPVLKTVQCSKCNDFYNAGLFQTIIFKSNENLRPIHERRRRLLHLLSSLR